MGYYDDYLEHHGILGQKWGVRRFENKNGHLTAEGKKRYDGDKVTEKEKHAFSAKAAGWKALSKTQAMNAKVYDKLGNKSMANIQKTVSKQSNQLAEKAQKEADAKKAEKEAAKGEKQGLTPEQKKKIAIAGAAVVGTALAAYGGYKLYQLNKQATEGLSKDFHQKAVSNRIAANKLNTKGFDLHDQGFKIARDSGADAGNKLMDLGVNYMHQASNHKNLAEQYDFRANNKNFSIKDKYNYLKGKNVDDDTTTRILKDSIHENIGKRAGLKSAADASLKAMEVAKKAKESQPAQNKQPNVIEKTAAKAAMKTSQSLAKKLTPPGAKKINSTMKVAGQTKFSQASKANDDLVSELLKKNASLLANF